VSIAKKTGAVNTKELTVKIAKQAKYHENAFKRQINECVMSKYGMLPRTYIRQYYYEI